VIRHRQVEGRHQHRPGNSEQPDELVKSNVFADRSEAIQEAVEGPNKVIGYICYGT